MENVFSFRNELIDEYQAFSRGFARIAADDILQEVERQYAAGRYWPEPLIQINPNYKRKGSVQELAQASELHPGCAEIFQFDKSGGNPQPLELVTVQRPAIGAGSGAAARPARRSAITPAR